MGQLDLAGAHADEALDVRDPGGLTSGRSRWPGSRERRRRRRSPICASAPTGLSACCPPRATCTASPTSSARPPYSALCMGSDADAKAARRARICGLAPVRGGYYGWMMLEGNRGLVALFTGDTPAARDAFREELRLSRELVVQPFAHEGLVGLAAVATIDADERPRRTPARRLGEPSQAIPSTTVQERLATQFVAPARERHGAEAWDAGRARGTRADLRRRGRLRPRGAARLGQLQRAQRGIQPAEALAASAYGRDHSGRGSMVRVTLTQSTPPRARRPTPRRPRRRAARRRRPRPRRRPSPRAASRARRRRSPATARERAPPPEMRPTRGRPPSSSTRSSASRSGEGDALEHRARQGAAVVAQAQPAKAPRAAGSACGVRSPAR
jgi:hypothetical protein